MPSAAGELPVGTCYSVGADTVVTAIDCAQLHDGQVIFNDVELGGVSPDEMDGAKLFDAAKPACTPEFETFTGSALGSETNDYDLRIVITSQPGARTVISCAVVDKTGAQWAGTAESVSGSYRGIGVGDCFDYPTNIADAAKLPCDQPHDAEMYLLDAALPADQLDPAAAYPTDAQWQDLSTTVCLTGFTDYTGLPFDTSTTLSFSYVYPLSDDWADVTKRSMSCVVIEEDGTKLVGSKKKP
ncbi:MAG: septum formation family protein [Nakamurella sp.]